MSKSTKHVEALLQQGLPAMDISAHKAEILIAYLELLQHWNRTHNLSAIRNPADMVTLHVFDSLSVLPHVHALRLADLGSGGGLPGIPLAIACPDRQITLIESNGKKCSFLRAAQRELGLTNLQVIQSRGEAHQPEVPYEAVISRAFASLADFWVLARPMLAQDGCVLAMKGRVEAAELAELPKEVVCQVRTLQVPGLQAERHLVELTSA